MSSMNAENENEMLGASWPTKSETEEWGQQFRTAGTSTSSAPAAAATVKQEQEEDNGDEDEESLTEIEISDSEEDEEGDYQETTNANDNAPKGIYYMMSRNKTDDGDDFGDSGEEDGQQDANEINEPPSEKILKIGRLIHSREMLQKVLCPLKYIQQFFKLSAIDEEEKNLLSLRKSRKSLGCFVAFRVQQQNENDSSEVNLPTGVYIDEIIKLENGTIKFKHYGSIKIDSIHPHYGQIGDEDFEKWLDIHIHASEELPRNAKKLGKKRIFFEKMEKAISSSILRRHLLPNPNKIFDGFVGQQPPIMPANIDISPIIIEQDHYAKLCKFFRATDFTNLNILSGLCILVDIGEIENHSMILPPLMILIKYMLIPISTAIFAPTTNNRHMKPSMIKLRTINGNGHVICSAQFMHKALKFPSEQLKLIHQISLAIWTLNNIPLPTPEYIHHKAAHFRDTLAIQIPAKTKQTANVILPPQHFVGLPLQNQNQRPSPNPNGNNNVQMKRKRKRPGKKQRMMMPIQKKPAQHFIGLPLQNQASSSNANNNNVQKGKRMRPAKHKRMKLQMQKKNAEVKREAQN